MRLCTVMCVFDQETRISQPFTNNILIPLMKEDITNEYKSSDPCHNIH